MINWTAVYVNLGVFLAIGIFSVIILSIIKFSQKGYKLLFVSYIFFWFPLMLLRAYTGSFQNSIDQTLMWIPLGIYGFVGIFARIFADLFVYRVRNRKNFIYLALIIQLITYIPILIWQGTATNVIQSIGVGFGASLIGTYQLLFNEQYSKEKHFLTISLLSIPPLLADTLSSPVQSLVMSLIPADASAHDKLGIMKYLWLIGLFIVLITFVIIYFYKENRNLLYRDNNTKKQLDQKNEIFYFVLIALIGLLVSFVKFSNTGALGTVHIEAISWYSHINPAPYQGYLSVIMSLGQLIGGLVTTMFFVKKIGKMWSFTIGTILWIIYNVLTMIVLNPFGYLTVHLLNGLSYGVIYNLILGLTLQKVFKTKKITPIGLYQAILSIGTTFSNSITGWLKGVALTECPKNANGKIIDYAPYLHTNVVVCITCVCVILITWIIFMYSWKIEKWNFNQLWWNRRKKYRH